MFFKDWRLCDISSVELNLDKQNIYYIHARAWAFKGLIGGTHSWFTFWSNKLNKWVVVENTDAETLYIQNGEIIHTNISGWLEKGPFISGRDPTQKWFGADPVIVGQVTNPGLDVSDFSKACDEYPIKEFKLLTQNCNTLSSYLILNFNLILYKHTIYI